MSCPLESLWNKHSTYQLLEEVCHCHLGELWQYNFNLLLSFSWKRILKRESVNVSVTETDPWKRRSKSSFWREEKQTFLWVSWPSSWSKQVVQKWDCWSTPGLVSFVPSIWAPTMSHTLLWGWDTVVTIRHIPHLQGAYVYSSGLPLAFTKPDWDAIYISSVAITEVLYLSAHSPGWEELPLFIIQVWDEDLVGSCVHWELKPPPSYSWEAQANPHHEASQLLTRDPRAS